MTMQRGRHVLAQDKDAIETGIDAIADHNVDQAVRAAQRHGWLGTLLGEWAETVPPPSTRYGGHDVPS